MWIGSGVSLLGCMVVVIAVVKIIRLKAYRPSELSRLSPVRRREVLRQIRGRAPMGGGEAHVVARDMAARRTLFGLCAGLLTTECGQLIGAHAWPWALVHAVIIGIVAVGTVMLYRDVRRARRLR
jgi:hypothetical protein